LKQEKNSKDDGQIDFWCHRNVLVTGCNGFLGAWLTKTLVSLGAVVTGLMRDEVPQSMLNRERIIKEINIVRGSIEDYDLVERSINEYEIDTVLHLAAQAIVGTAIRSPISTFETNIKGTWNVLEACRQVNTVKRVIIASSDKAYGVHERLPYTEDAPLQGRYPYDVSKSCADLLSQAYFATYALPVCVTRCGNMFGGGDLNFNRIVPGTIRSALSNQRPIIRSDGTLVRDYIYVRDVVEAYLLLAQKMGDLKLQGQAFNFSNERQLNVLELTEMILHLLGRPDLRPVILNEAKSEIKNQFLCAEKAHACLGWQSIYGMEQGLLETIEWYRAFFNDESPP